MNPNVNLAYSRRALILTGIYSAIVSASFYLAYELRFDFVVPEEHQQDRLRLLPFVVGIKLIALIAARQLGSMMTYFSIPDLLRLAWAMSASSFTPLLLRLSEATASPSRLDRTRTPWRAPYRAESGRRLQKCTVALIFVTIGSV